MKKILYTLATISLMSLSAFALDPSLDPNLSPADTQQSSKSNAISIDNAKFQAETPPNGVNCQLCNTFGGTRYENTIATKKTPQSNTDTSSSPATGVDSGSQTDH